jgi:Ca2+-binding EF-hand superfamily protein
LTSAFNSALKNGTKRATDGKVSSTHSARKLAKKLFEGLDEDQGGVITRNEFEPYFKTAGEAAMAFNLFDKDGNGDIDRKEMRNAVVRIYKERRALALGLRVCSSYGKYTFKR